MVIILPDKKKKKLSVLFVKIVDSSSSLYIYIFPLRIVLILIANIYVVAKDLFSKLRLFIV